MLTSTNGQIAVLMMFRAIRSFLITMPIIVIYWQIHGMGMQDIFILQVIFSIAVIVLEIPTGYFTDLIGRKPALILGSIAGAIGFYCYSAFPSYGGFVVAELALALSVGFISGAQEALLYETLEEAGRLEENTKWQGRLLTTGSFSEATAAVATGVIAVYFSIGSILEMQWLIVALAVPLTLLLREKGTPAQAVSTPPLLQILHGNFRTNKRLRALMLLAAGLGAATLTMVWFVQPYWQSAGIDASYFGYLWAGLHMVVGIGGLLAGYAERIWRFRKLFAVLAIMPLLLYTMMASSPWPLVVIPMFWLLHGIARPIINDYVQREASRQDRATIISINRLGERLAFSVFSPFVGWLAEVWSFETAFLVAGLIFGSLSVTGYLLMLLALRKKALA